MAQRHMNLAAGRREFQRIGEQVDQGLVEAHAVTVDSLLPDVLDEDVKHLLFRADLGLYYTDDVVHDLPQGDELHVQR